MHNFKIAINFVKHFLNQSYILAAFKNDRTKVVILKKYQLLCSTTQGLDTQIVDKKIIYII